MGGLKDELLKAIWHAFTALDLDRSGKVSKSQLKVGSRLPALRGGGGNGTRGGVRWEGWLGKLWGGDPRASFWPLGGARGRTRSSGSRDGCGVLKGASQDLRGALL